MTLEQLIHITDRYRLYIIRGNDQFMKERKRGVRINRYVTSGDILNLRMLAYLQEANLNRSLSADVVLPSWLSIICFDSFLSVINKRLTL